MSHEHLGLFDTPPSRRDWWLAAVIVGGLFGILLLALPNCNDRWPEVAAFVPSVSTGMFVSELIIGALLYAQAVVFRSHALTVLASGYVMMALLLIPYVLTFPGAFTPGGLLQPGLNTTAWLMIIRRAAFPIAVILYTMLKPRDGVTEADPERTPPSVRLGIWGAGVLAALVTIVATIGHDLLPPVFTNRTDAILPNITIVNAVEVGLAFAAVVMLLRRCHSVLDVWLVVAMGAWLIQDLLNVPLRARYTEGWYGLYVLMVVSNVFVLLALIRESNRLYIRLALSTAAQIREREARMLSMDAVAATLSHELGQPLAAVKLSASAALRWLTREPPDPQRAIATVNDTIDASHRAIDVMKSVRATYGRGSMSEGAFSLNDLARECAALLHREFAAQKVSLLSELDDTIPPVIANRVQIQRVLVNLLTNAIESIAAAGPRVRRITIRTSQNANSESVRLEVQDSGDGIAPEAMEQIFEPFFTTKTSGTGLGLSLSRTIVEGHGGSLWASQSDGGGAVFHLQLRSNPATQARPLDLQSS